ncbi:hypothetical protein D3C84_1088090 [compost metagenome]
MYLSSTFSSCRALRHKKYPESVGFGLSPLTGVKIAELRELIKSIAQGAAGPLDIPSPIEL